MAFPVLCNTRATIHLYVLIVLVDLQVYFFKESTKIHVNLKVKKGWMDNEVLKVQMDCQGEDYTLNL